MLEENVTRDQDTREIKTDAGDRIVCFVCKKEVDRDEAKKIRHSKHRQVWVCEAHIKP